MPSEAIALLTQMALADKIKVNKDPILQISALESPALDDTATTEIASTLTPAEDNLQNLNLLDSTHTDRAPSPPPSTHRADDLPPPSSSIPIEAEADSGGDTPMHADDRQVEHTADPTDEVAASEQRDAPLIADSVTTTVDDDDNITTNGPRSMDPPSPALQQHVYPTRIRRAQDRLNLLCVNHMTARKALKENPDEALQVIRKELDTLLRKKAFHGRNYDDLTQEQRKGIIRSQMNVTQKYAPSSDGNGRVKDKLKARLVGGGDCQYTHVQKHPPPPQAPPPSSL